MKELLNPKSVVVIGASREPEKIGYIIFDNLVSGFSGKVFGVNPNAQEILGEKIYKTVLDIPAKLDMAVLAVPPKLVPQVLESCGKKKIKVAIIITAGFSEAGHTGAEREKEIEAITKKFGIRVLGPNCLGVINNFTGLNASFATAKLPSKYRVGIFSQSGAMGSAILDFANGHNFGFSYFVSLGNKSDISELDLIKEWEEDENVTLGVGYLEDVKDGAEFLKACRRFTAKKPLILLKGGMSKEGTQAARLHTAAMAQDEVVFKQAMKESGVVLAKNLGDLFELAVAFSAAKTPKGRNLAILSNAGGPSVLGADACAFEGVSLAKISAPTAHEIAQNTQAASVENPIDLRGDASSQDFKTALWALEADRSVEGILVIVTPQAMTEVEPIAYEIAAYNQKGTKPVYVNFIGGEIVGRAIEICGENRVPTFGFPERAVRAFSFMADYGQLKAEKASKPKPHPNKEMVSSIIKFPTHLSAERLFKVLDAYGIKMARTKLVKTAAQASNSLAVIKPPLVMKISSPDILHKTDVGGVVMGVTRPEEAAKAFEKILANVKKRAPHAEIDGITVMETAHEGLEVIVGAKKDPTFGPTLMFGIGGIFVELISDFSVILAPFSEEKIRDMIEKTAAAKIIKGYRGRNAYSEKALIEAIKGVGQLILDHPEIVQLEINPIVLTEKGALGLDAKIEIAKR